MLRATMQRQFGVTTTLDLGVDTEIAHFLRSIEGVADLRAEVALLQKLHHRNIVKYMDSLATEDMFYIVLELVEDGSLAGAIKRLGPLRDEAVVAAYVAQVLRCRKFPY
jgi:serine/threonine protein kinase